MDAFNNALNGLFVPRKEQHETNSMRGCRMNDIIGIELEQSLTTRAPCWSLRFPFKGKGKGKGKRSPQLNVVLASECDFSDKDNFSFLRPLGV